MEVEELKFWIHPEGWVYTGDQIEGARAATDEEIQNHHKLITGMNED